MAILIKQDAAEPEFLWIPCKTREWVGKDLLKFSSDPDEEEADAEMLEGLELAKSLGVPFRDAGTSTHLPTEATFCGRAGFDTDGIKTLVCGKRGRGESLNCSVRIALASSFMSDDCGTNKCIARLLGRDLKGTAILLAMTKVLVSTEVLDIDTRSFTLALDALASSGDQASREPKEKVKGVAISAREPHYHQVDIPVTHPIFTKGRLSKAVQLMGEEVRTYKQPSPSSGPSTSSSVTDAPVNPAAWLSTDVDPNSPTFGQIPADIKVDPTTVLVATTVFGKAHSNQLEWVKQTIVFLEKEMPDMLSDASSTPVKRCEAVRTLFQQAMNEEVGELMRDLFLTGSANGGGQTGPPTHAAESNGGAAATE